MITSGKGKGKAMTYEIALDLLTMEYKSALAMENEENQFWSEEAIKTKRETVKKMMREVAEYFGTSYRHVLDDVRESCK